MADIPTVESNSPAASPVPPGPQQIIVQQSPPTALGKYGKLVLAALAIAVMTIVGQYASYKRYFSPPDMPQERYNSLSTSATDKIAVIRVEGAILDPEGFVKKQIDRVREDKDVVAVVLRIDSPGGTVTASDYLYHHLRKLVKDRELPLVVSMGSICASGGYYLAMAVGDKADAIYAEPTTWTGSIGVVIPHYDVSGLLTAWDVKDDSVASHKWKLMGSPTRALSEEERAEERKLLQSLVDVSFARFKQIVRDGRPKLAADEAALDAASTGQVFTAQQALEKGLVDKIGFLDDAVNHAAELAGRDSKNVRCVKYDDPRTSLTSLLGVASNIPSAKWDLSALLDLTAPRAYFLCTWMPAVLTNSR